MSLVAARSAWITALSTGLPGVNVFAFGGRFDQKALTEYSKRAPALALALMRFDPVKQGGVTTSIAYWALIGFTTNSKQGRGDRDETCIALLESAAHIVCQTFAGENSSGAVSRSMDVVARNLFGFDLDRANVAMWGMEFQQQIDLVQVFDYAPFERMHLVWDLAPRDVAAGDGPPDPPHAPDPYEIPEAEDDIDLPQ